MEDGEFEYHSANVIATDPLPSARPVSKTLIASKALRLGISYFVVYMLCCSFVFVSPILNLLIIAICISEQYGAFSLAGQAQKIWLKRALFTLLTPPMLFTLGAGIGFIISPADHWTKSARLIDRRQIGNSEIRIYLEYIALGSDNTLVVQRSGLMGSSIKYDHFIGRFIGLDSKSWQEPKTVLRLQESIIKSGRRSATITFFENGSYQIQKDQ